MHTHSGLQSTISKFYVSSNPKKGISNLLHSYGYKFSPGYKILDLHKFYFM